MYKAFRLNLQDIQAVVQTYWMYGQKQSVDLKSKLQSGLLKYMNVNGVLDGQRIMNDWFSQVKVDVFISHSHRDLKSVHALSGWLYQTFGLTSFIDSDIWGYCDDLIKEMDKAYSKDANGNLDYSKIRETTAHVHVMLMSALSMMINKTECLFFIDSDQSITARDSVLKTGSPWIYNELLISSMIRPQEIERPQFRIEDSLVLFERREFSAAEMRIDYPAVHKHMKTITWPDLKDWKGLCNKYGNQNKASYHEFPLDVLYWLKR